MDDAVGLAGHILGVGDQDEGLPVLAVELAEQLHDVGGVGAVEVSRGLVAPDDLGLVHQGPRDGHTLLLAAGELRRVVLLPVGEPHERQRFGGALAGLGGSGARDQHWHLDVLHRGEHGEQVEGLEDVAHAGGAVARLLVVGHGGQLGAADAHAARVDLVEAGEAVEQRGLAAAARPHDGDHLAALHGQVDASERFDGQPTGIVGLVYVDRPDNWGWGLRRHAGDFTGPNLLLGSASTLLECERFLN